MLCAWLQFVRREQRQGHKRGRQLNNAQETTEQHSRRAHGGLSPVVAERELNTMKKIRPAYYARTRATPYCQRWGHDASQLCCDEQRVRVAVFWYRSMNRVGVRVAIKEAIARALVWVQIWVI